MSPRKQVSVIVFLLATLACVAPSTADVFSMAGSDQFLTIDSISGDPTLTTVTATLESRIETVFGNANVDFSVTAGGTSLIGAGEFAFLDAGDSVDVMLGADATQGDVGISSGFVDSSVSLLIDVDFFAPEPVTIGMTYDADATAVVTGSSGFDRIGLSDAFTELDFIAPPLPPPTPTVAFVDSLLAGDGLESASTTAFPITLTLDPGEFAYIILTASSLADATSNVPEPGPVTLGASLLLCCVGWHLKRRRKASGG